MKSSYKLIRERQDKLPNDKWAKNTNRQFTDMENKTGRYIYI